MSVTPGYNFINTSSDSAAGVAVVGAAAAAGREQFATAELAIVLSHFDIGVIREIREFPRGSRKAPKLYIESEVGQYLLKRRARGRDDAAKVAFSHLIQLHLAQQQFPLPHLIGTRRDNNSLLQLGPTIYELFEYIPGQGYPQTLDSTAESGRVLALYHKLLENFHPDHIPPTPGSFHGAVAVEHGLMHIPKVILAPDAAQICNGLNDMYHLAAARAEALGLTEWPLQIVHADWHPGNMLYREGRVVAVIDYDSSRMLPRVIDAANGALQFSIQGGDDALEKWPSGLDESRFVRFVKGYDEVMLLSQAELDAIPWLMIEALIAEAVFPIAQTGRFSRFEGIAFLKMVKRKTDWLRDQAKRLVALASA